MMKMPIQYRVTGPFQRKGPIEKPPAGPPEGNQQAIKACVCLAGPEGPRNNEG